MNIIALMLATEAYCCVWEEDAQHKFITFIPPNIPNKPSYYYYSGCVTFNDMEQFRADLRNGILTYQTLDHTGLILAPIMLGNSSTSKYFKYIKLYAMLTGKDLDDVDIKVKFISGLSSDNKKRTEEFGFKKPLKI
ncbi:13067_t:CDS:2 [Funneliformis mosseae]|uniref:13067_t:CDS:1 n=1 Tax=Funneliformis mosseae TaxID=27381 RepID=A0A9N9EA98_FUNMO|nr:13067_t:CDS:2 [Funneliformis mosseae]